MSRQNTHELFYRVIAEDGSVSLARFAAIQHPENEAREDLIKFCQEVCAAKDGPVNKYRDAILYKVNGSTEFFVSRHFYLWPNTLDRDDRFSGKNRPQRTRTFQTRKN